MPHLLPQVPPQVLLYEDWLKRLNDAVMNHGAFTAHDGSELRVDADALTSVFNITSVQKAVQTSVFQLRAASEMHEVGRPPSAVPPLARAALETASTAVWALLPDDPRGRRQRTISMQLQENYDESQYRGAGWSRTYSDVKNNLYDVAQSCGIPKSAFKQAFSPTRAIAVVEKELDLAGTLDAWSLMSGLSHGRHWAIHEAAGAGLPGAAHMLLTVPREVFGMHQLRAAAVLNEAIRLWNTRSGCRTDQAVPDCPIPTLGLLSMSYPPRHNGSPRASNPVARIR